MPKPVDELKNPEYIEETYLLYQSISDNCRDIENCKKFLKDILTPSELRMLKRRWFIARLLTAGKSIRAVAHEAKVSTATVVRISQILNNPSGMLKKAVESIRSEPPDKKFSPTPRRYIFGHE